MTNGSLAMRAPCIGHVLSPRARRWQVGGVAGTVFWVATRVYIDGRIHDEGTAVIPVFDRGFLYGDSVYEVTRTVAGRPVDLGRHLDRLARSAAAIGILAPPAAEVAAATAETLAAAGNPESYVRIVVTRGGGEI